MKWIHKWIGWVCWNTTLWVEHTFWVFLSTCHILFSTYQLYASFKYIFNNSKYEQTNNFVTMDKLTVGKLEYRMTEHLFLIWKAVNVWQYELSKTKYMYRQNISFTYVPPHRLLVSLIHNYIFFYDNDIEIMNIEMLSLSTL